MTQDAPFEKRLRILCVDDNEQIRILFEFAMVDRSEFEVLPSLESADRLLQVIPQVRPDVVVLDLSIPGCNPLQVMTQARAQFPAIRFLVYSAYDDEAFVESAFRSGASGYFPKWGDYNKMAEAIRKVADGETVIPNFSRMR